MLTGHRAAGHGDQSHKVGRWLRLRSCDWLGAPGGCGGGGGGGRLMISHVPGVQQSSDPRMKE